LKGHQKNFKYRIEFFRDSQNIQWVLSKSEKRF
jgi:hypothetical protein